MKINRIFICIILIFISIYMFFLVSTIFYNKNEQLYKYDAIIVLGYSLEDGDNPSSWLVHRMAVALNLYNLGYSDNIIVAGGQGPNDNLPVGESMKKWLVSKGVPPERIFADDKSRTTYENFVYSKIICDEHNFNTIMVVTNDFHLHRAMIISKEFFSNSSGQEASLPLSYRKILVYLKEPFSLLKYYAFDKNSASKYADLS